MVSSSFFGYFGDQIDFKDGTDLRKKFSKINCSVPSRTGGRTSEHRERFCLEFYLFKLSQHNLLTFPVSVRKGETPDFLITDGTGQTIGVEHTDATTEDYQKALTDLDKSEEGTSLELDVFKISRGPLSKNELSNAFHSPGSKLAGDGWYGYKVVEEEWSTIIARSVDKKTEDLNKKDYGYADIYELLIYSNTHLPNIRPEIALRMLVQKIQQNLEGYGFNRIFDSVTVIYGQKLFHDVTNRELILEETGNYRQT